MGQTFRDRDGLGKHSAIGISLHALDAQMAAEQLAARASVIEAEHVARDVGQPPAVGEVRIRVSQQRFESFAPCRNGAIASKEALIDLR